MEPREKGTLPRSWWEYKLVQPLWKAAWRFLKKLELPCEIAILLPDIYLEKIKTLIEKILYVPQLMTVLITTDMEATQVLINRWMDDEHMGCVWVYI